MIIFNWFIIFLNTEKGYKFRKCYGLPTFSEEQNWLLSSKSKSRRIYLRESNACTSSNLYDVVTQIRVTGFSSPFILGLKVSRIVIVSNNAAILGKNVCIFGSLDGTEFSKQTCQQEQTLLTPSMEFSDVHSSRFIPQTV